LAVPADLDQQVAAAFRDFLEEIERLAQLAASTEAVLSKKGATEEWKRAATFEYELGYEVQYLKQMQGAIERRIADRQAMLDEQVAKRQREWGEQQGERP
jgi:hypothetical protein